MPGREPGETWDTQASRQGQGNVTGDGSTKMQQCPKPEAMLSPGWSPSAHQAPTPTATGLEGPWLRVDSGCPQTHLRAPSQGDDAGEQVADHVLQAHIQALHVDGVDEPQAVLQGPQTAMAAQLTGAPQPACSPGCPPHPEHFRVVQPRHKHQRLWSEQLARWDGRCRWQSHWASLICLLLPPSSVLGTHGFL